MTSKERRRLGFWGRKLLHLGVTASAAILALYLPIEWVKPFGLIVFMSILVFEFVRLKTAARKFVNDTVGALFKKNEGVKFSALFWGSLGVLIVILMADPIAVSYSLAILAVCDSLAAMTGKRFGKKKIYLRKTWVGSMACFASALLLSLVYSYAIPNTGLAIAWSVFMAGVITVIEVFSYPFDDNFSIPVVSGLFMYLLFLTQYTWVVGG